MVKITSYELISSRAQASEEVVAFKCVVQDKPKLPSLLYCLVFT